MYNMIQKYSLLNPGGTQGAYVSYWSTFGQFLVVSTIAGGIWSQAQTHRLSLQSNGRDDLLCVLLQCSCPAPVPIVENKAWLEEDSDRFPLFIKPWV